MTIEIKVTNPAEHQPSELRAVALFLNNLAADREAGRIASAHVMTHGTALLAAGPTGEIPKADAPSASSEPQVPSADAEDDQNTSSDELDSKGVRYDARIHSANRSQNADKTWRMKRGVDEALVKQVLAEQKQPDNYAEKPEDDTPPPVIEEDEAPAPPIEETPPPVVTAAPSMTPGELLKYITSNGIGADRAKVIYTQFGLKDAAGLFNPANSHLIPVIYEAVQALVAD